MRAVVQRVAEAHVTVCANESGDRENVQHETTGRIGAGVLVYLGCGKGDAEVDVEWMLEKILGLRIFENDAGKLDRSVLEMGGSMLVVSQFTLYGDVRKGRRPSFEGALAPEAARALYDSFCAKAKARLTVATGRFQADMRVASINEGPITIWIESPKRAEMNA
jgi:D-tyrosyl-tRNA(Tyr) deacylase